MTIAFTTLGCKVNQYDTEALRELFAREGFFVVGEDDAPDVYVVNSCTVTAGGDAKSRRALRHHRTINPNALTVLTGCFPQAFPQEAAAVSEADIVTGSKDRAALVALVKEALETRRRIVSVAAHEAGDTFEPLSIEHFSGRTRAFLKIEDGCDHNCAYCAIPQARGHVRSKPLDLVVRELCTLAEHGFREVVLVGIDLSSYGRDIGLRLVDAVEAAQDTGVARIRLGSLETELIDERDLRRLHDCPSFCPQFHLSLQSGCDDTLKRMRRRYLTQHYRQRVADIRAIFDNPSLTTDILVGFPGETQREFDETLAFVREIGFLRAHIFPYSRRKGTVAYDLPDQLPRAVKESRVRALRAVCDEGRQAFLQTQRGHTARVLFESTHKDGCAVGYTENYVEVRVRGAENRENTIQTVRINAVKNGYCTGIAE